MKLKGRYRFNNCQEKIMVGKEKLQQYCLKREK